MKSGVADFQRKEAPVVQEQDEGWFHSQLMRVSVVEEAGRDFNIVCPFHDDHTPSLGVDRFTGVFHCWGCKKGGHWNQLAYKLNLERLPFGNEVAVTNQSLTGEVSRALTKMGVALSRHGDRGDISRPLVTKWQGDWRGMKESFLQRVGCIEVNNMVQNVKRIGLPVRTPEGDLLGYTCRAVDPADAEPKYWPLSPDSRNWRERELPAAKALFLIEHALDEGWETIVLVEGPADALRLYEAGIPAVALLGVSNWTDIKASILVGLGFKRVFVMMDADRAGREGQARILSDLSSLVPATGLKLPKGVKDPDQLSDKQLQWVADRVRRG